MTFIADLAAVEDNIGYRVWPLSEVKATPEKRETIKTISFVNIFTSACMSTTHPHTHIITTTSRMYGKKIYFVKLKAFNVMSE